MQSILILVVFIINAGYMWVAPIRISQGHTTTRQQGLLYKRVEKRYLSELVDQLAAGGQMVIPVGPPGGYQTLWRFVKEPDGELRAFNMGGVAFVPFTGEGTRQGQSEGFVP